MATISEWLAAKRQEREGRQHTRRRELEDKYADTEVTPQMLDAARSGFSQGDEIAFLEAAKRQQDVTRQARDKWPGWIIASDSTIASLTGEPTNNQQAADAPVNLGVGSPPTARMSLSPRAAEDASMRGLNSLSQIVSGNRIVRPEGVATFGPTGDGQTRGAFGTWSTGTSAPTDAEARKRLVTNLGLKDESELKYDAFGNIRNVTDQINTQTKMLQDARRGSVMSLAKRVQDEYDLANMTPERAQSLIQAEQVATAAGQQANWDQTVERAQLAIKQVEANAKMKEASAKAQEAMSKAYNEPLEIRRQAIGDNIRNFIEVAGVDGIDPEEMLQINALAKVFAATMGDYWSESKQQYISREEIQALADQQYGGDTTRVRELLTQEDDEAFDADAYMSKFTGTTEE